MNKLLFFSFLLFSLLVKSSAEEPLNFNNDVYPFENEVKEILFYSLLVELRCPKCQSSNLAGSNSPISNDLKREVYELVLEGNSEEEIKSHLIQRYGNFIVYNPPLEPETYILWFGPFALIFIAILVIFIIRKRIIK
ncbi:MAG: cytochrome c-type biogenesis protein [Gammaproteobacteria bacterium]